MFKVQRLGRGDEKLGDAICESLKTAYDPSISRFFVHQDAGYKRFFHSILDHPSYANYYSYDSETRELHGFACFQIIEEILFLKHIVVNNRLRGSKIGTKLLYYALKDIQEKSQKTYELLQLHVFEKNSRALSWYLSIGMKIVDCTYWYDLSAVLKGAMIRTDNDNTSPVTVSKDMFGFLQVNHSDFFIGTLLAQKTLIIKNPTALQHIAVLVSFVKQYNVESVCFTSNAAYDFDLVDKALLMSTPVHTLELV